MTITPQQMTIVSEAVVGQCFSRVTCLLLSVSIVAWTRAVAVWFVSCDRETRITMGGCEERGVVRREVRLTTRHGNPELYRLVRLSESARG